MRVSITYEDFDKFDNLAIFLITNLKKKEE